MSAGQTTNHKLIYPNADDPVPNWPQINQINSDKFDSLFNAFVFQNYTPSLANSGGNPNIGDEGQLLGKFYKLFDIYFYYIWLRLGGSGVDMGAGTVRITLPVVVHPDYPQAAGGAVLGGGYWFDSDNGFSRTPLTVQLSGTGNRDTLFFSMARNANGRSNYFLQGDDPTTMVAGDQLEVYGNFKAASA